MRIVVTEFNKRFRSQKRLDSRAFTDVIIDRGNIITKYLKSIYDLTHLTWNAHPYFAPAYVIKGRKGYAGIMEFGVILDDAKSDTEYDRSIYSEPVSSGQVWRWLDSGVSERWSYADNEDFYFSKTYPNRITATEGQGFMKYRGKREMMMHKLKPGVIEPRNWSEIIGEKAKYMYKNGMRDASRDATNAFKRELRKI